MSTRSTGAWPGIRRAGHASARYESIIDLKKRGSRIEEFLAARAVKSPGRAPTRNDHAQETSAFGCHQARHETNPGTQPAHQSLGQRQADRAAAQPLR